MSKYLKVEIIFTFSMPVYYTFQVNNGVLSPNAFIMEDKSITHSKSIKYSCSEPGIDQYEIS